MGIFVGAVADDDTGATDLAGMLTEQGLRVIIVTQDAVVEDLQRWSQEADAVIIGTASRSIARAEAYTRTAAAVRALLTLSPQRLAVKYCSTFDSTAEGNIGPSIDAAMDVTGESFTIALPALPSLGRTTYMGYHFVGNKLLSDSSMRHHPLNPMHNPHLPSHLATQSERKVELAEFLDGVDANFLRLRLNELRQAGANIVLLDCVSDAHLQHICEAISDLPLITGSSAWGSVLPAIWRSSGTLAVKLSNDPPARRAGGSGFLIVSGSCSEATRAQNARAAASGYSICELDAGALLAGRALGSGLADRVATVLREGSVCLVSTTPVGVSGTSHSQTWSEGHSSTEIGSRIETELAQFVIDVVTRCPPQGLIVAGGETSSTLMREMSLGGLRIGSNIEPGVPVCISLARPELAVVLKSGNFGSENFYCRAIQAMRNLPVEGTA